MAGITGGAGKRDEHIRIFGPKLGPVYYELHNEVVWLYAKWLEYRKLYAESEKRINLLNETASFFFYAIEAVLREDVLLHISRLTDPPRKSKYKMLSLLILPTLVNDKMLENELEILLKESLIKCKFAREWRNRQIAHSDYSLAINVDGTAKGLPSVSRQQIGEAIDSIKVVLNRVSEAYSHTPTAFELFHTSSGADTLTFYLGEGVASEKRKRARLLSSKPYPEDFE
jgi:hypothetical protein